MDLGLFRCGGNPERRHKHLLVSVVLAALAWYLLRRRQHSGATVKGATAAVPPPGEVRGKDFIDPESGSDSGSGGSGGKSSVPCFPWSKQQQEDSRCALSAVGS